MELNRGQLDSLFLGFKTSLKAGIAKANLPVELFATIIPSTTDMERYPFTELMSTMREWVGPRQIQNMMTQLVDIINKDFEHTIGVKRNDIEDGLR